MTETTEYLLTRLVLIDELLKDIDSWTNPAINGGIDHKIVMGEIEVEHGLIEAREALQKLIAVADTEYVRQHLPVRMCQCVEADNSLCAIHTIGHPYTESCCEQSEDNHRHMTDDEYKIACPKIFDETVQVEDLKYRVDARHYSTGNWVTLTQLFPSEESDDDDYGGLCFDISLDALRSMLPLLQRVVEL